MVMATLLSLLLFLAMVTHSSGTWCICKEGVSDAALQKTLDYACGQGGDCNPTHQNGPCFNPNTVRAHCNYAVNSYFQKKGQTPTACDFAATATIVTSDPSVAGCSYPASASASTITTVTPGTTTTGGSTPGSATPSVTTPAGNSPLVTGSSNGVLGGNGGLNNNGLGPAGVGLNPDNSMGRILLPNSSNIYYIMIMLVFFSFIF